MGTTGARAGTVASVASVANPVAAYSQAPKARAAVRGVLLLQLAANGIGITVVVAYLLVFFPVEDGGDTIVGLNLAVFGVYVVLTLLVAAPVNAHFLKRAVGWVAEGRAPTAAERHETLLQPARQTASALLGWLGAALVFGLLNDDRERIGWGIAIAGMLVCAILYQLLERHFRPLFALALDGVDWVGRNREVLPRIMLAWWVGSAIPLLLIGVAPQVLPDEQIPALLTRMTSLVVLCLVAGGLVMRGAAESVAEPVEQVRHAMAEVEEGHLDTHVAVDHVGELGRLQAGFNAMVLGLRERHRIEDLFGRLVGTDVARQAMARDPELGGEERVITALFVDRAGFTAYAEQHSPVEIVAELNRFFAVVIEVVESEGGWVNKFEGDAALCLFGAPADQVDHAARALRAAWRLPAAVAALPHAPKVGVGVATGTVVAGHIGTQARHEYTVIGDAVNVAARLTELAKDHEAHVLAAGSTVASATAAAHDVRAWRSAGPTQLRGRSAPIELFEPDPAVGDLRAQSSTAGLPSGPQS